MRSVSYIVLKFHELWSTNGLKWDRNFTRPYYFVPSQSIAHPLIGIHMAPDSDSKNETALDLSAAQIRSQKYVKLEMLSRRAALSGTTSL